MTARSFICCLLLGALAAGCAAHGPAAGGAGAPQDAALSSIDWVDLAGSWSGPEQYRVELVKFVDGRTGVSHLIRYDIQLAPGRLVMVAQTPLGVPLYESKVSAGTVEVVPHVAQLEAVPVERVLADFVLANWPLEALTPAARAAGYTILHKGGIRQLLDVAGRLLVEVRLASASNDNVTEISHHDIPLKLSIHTIETTVPTRGR